MRQSGMQWAAMALAAGGLALLLTACDKIESESTKTENRVQADLAKSVDVAKTDISDARQELQRKWLKDAQKEAQSEPADSPVRKLSWLATRVEASNELAHHEYQEGDALLCKVEMNEDDIRLLLWRISEWGRQIDGINDRMARFKLLEPTDAQKANQDDLDAEQKTLDDINTKISGLEREISSRQETMRQQADERNQDLAQAQDFYDQSVAAKGQESVDLSQKSTDMKEKAGMLATDIDAEKVQIVQYEHDLQVEQAQQAIRERAVQDFQTSLDSNKLAWTNTQNTSKAENDRAKALVDSDIVPAAAQLKDLLDKTQQLRQTAAQDIQDAQAHYQEALAGAEKLQTAVVQLLNNEHFSTSADREAWKNLAYVYNVNYIRVLLGNAQAAHAALLVTSVDEMDLRHRYADTLQPIFQTAGADLPEVLQAKDVDMDKDFKSQQKATGEAFAQAAATFGAVVPPPPQISEKGDLEQKEEQNQAKVYFMFASFGAYQHTDPPDPKDLSKALETRKEITWPLPQLPAGLGGVINRMVMLPGRGGASAAAAGPGGATQGPTLTGDAGAAKAVADQYISDVSNFQFDDAKALTQVSEDQDQISLAWGGVIQSRNKLFAKIAEKIPKDAAQVSHIFIPDPVAWERTATVKVDGDTATLTPTGDVNAKPMTLKKLDSGWKVIDFGGADPQLWNAIAQVVETVTADVDSGVDRGIDDVTNDLTTKMAAANLTVGAPATQPQ